MPDNVKYTVANFFRIEQLNSVFLTFLRATSLNHQQLSHSVFQILESMLEIHSYFSSCSHLLKCNSNFQRNISTVSTLCARFFWASATPSGLQKRRVRNCWWWKKENQQRRIKTTREKPLLGFKKIDKKFIRRRTARNTKRKKISLRKMRGKITWM